MLYKTLKILPLIILAFAMETSNATKIETKEIKYEADGTLMHGYVAYPAGAKDRPGILVVHEWWGQTDYPRKRARMIAEQLGYVAFAVDMYGEGKTADHPESAKEFASKARSDRAKTKGRFKAAMEQLQGLPQVNPQNIGAIGYCFGGGVVLQMARQGVDLDGVVSFHGSLPLESAVEKGQVKAKVLVLNGADDPMVTQEQIQKFKADMKKANADFEFVNYEGAKHAFTNPEATEKGKKFNMPIAYDKEADEKSWQRMKEFFRGIFGKTQK